MKKRILLLLAVILFCLTIQAEDMQCMYVCQYEQGFSWDYCRRLCHY